MLWLGFGALAVVTAVLMLRTLLRDRQERVVSGVLLIVLVTGSLGLYARWSNWESIDPQSSGSDSETPIGRLARQLERNPDDLDGWLELGRAHLSVGQFPLAQRAFRRADRLAEGRSADALMGVAETMVLEAEGEVDARAGRLFEMALALEPQSEKALFFSAVAAQNRGEFVLAIERYEGMLALSPPPEIERILQQQIAELRGRSNTPPATTAAAAVGAAGEAVDTPRIEIDLQLAAGLEQRITATSGLFVFVRKPNQGGPPLAAKRLAPNFPQRVVLTPADSMVPGLAFAAGDQVEVSAKISADGSATPKADDLLGSIRYTVGRDVSKVLIVSGPAQ
jgi:cytochrome c-type biogenesis protein CcmH